MINQDVLQEYMNRIYRFSLIILKNKEDAEDVSQEVIYRFLTKVPDGLSKDEEIAWLYRVAVNLCHDMRKNSWYKKRIPLSEMEQIGEFKKERDESVLESIRELPVKYSEIIILYYYEGYSVKEIGELLNKKENTIYSLLARGRKILEKKLKEDYNE